MSEEIDDIEENGSVEEDAPVADGTEQGAQESEAEDPADTDESAPDGPSDASSDEPSSEDCPPCNKGAPAWMATFADMATLLMAFLFSSFHSLTQRYASSSRLMAPYRMRLGLKRFGRRYKSPEEGRYLFRTIRPRSLSAP